MGGSLVWGTRAQHRPRKFWGGSDPTDICGIAEHGFGMELSPFNSGKKGKNGNSQPEYWGCTPKFVLMTPRGICGENPSPNPLKTQQGHRGFRAGFSHRVNPSEGGMSSVGTPHPHLIPIPFLIPTKQLLPGLALPCFIRCHNGNKFPFQGHCPGERKEPRPPSGSCESRGLGDIVWGHFLAVTPHRDVPKFPDAILGCRCQCHPKSLSLFTVRQEAGRDFRDSPGF